LPRAERRGDYVLETHNGDSIQGTHLLSRT
jgi:hypothetical protein